MKRRVLYLKFLIIILLLFGCNKEDEVVDTSMVTPYKTYSLEDVQSDYKQLEKLINYSPQLYTNKEELKQLCETQSKLLKDNMEELEFYRVVSPIISKLNCGHSSIRYSQEYNDFINQNGKFLPLDIKIIDGKAYLYDSYIKTEIPEASEILEINHQSIQDILDTFLKNISADGTNTTTKYYIINSSFSDLYYKYIDNSDHFLITYNDSESHKQKETTVNAIKKEEINQAVDASNRSKLEIEEYSKQFENGYAILKITTFSFYDNVKRKEFTEFIDEFFKELKDKKIKNLILDLRDNWGGDPYCGAHLFSNLIQSESSYFAYGTPYYSGLAVQISPGANTFDGNLYTLINGASFSTTGHLCSLLKFHKIGTFIGEESGGSFACTDGSYEQTLFKTKLHVRLSRTKYETAVSGLTPGRGIVPDHTVTPTIEDLLKNTDSVMLYTIDLIQNTNQ